MLSVPFSEEEVTRVVEDAVQNGIIRGTKEYNKDEYISGAVAATSTKVFSDNAGEGSKVFYKVRLKALDPRNFKNSGDIGTLAVRYIVTPQGDKHTILRIDARFVEDFRHTVHASNGSVESEEYKIIRDHLENLELVKAEALEVKKGNDAERERKLKNTQMSSSQSQPAAVNTPERQPAPASPNATIVAANNAPVAPAVNSATPKSSDTEALTLEQRVKDLRGQVERRVKAPGAPLKADPFHSATNLRSLPAGTEVLIVISTTYWLGVETHDGQHGWLLRDELEPIE
jgi:hypothetical protein